jgi:uncharacterized protein (DUF433 family)
MGVVIGHLFPSRHRPDVLPLKHGAIHSDTELMGGTLVFQGTRVSVQKLLDYLDNGNSMDGFLEMFPFVHREDAEEFFRLARGPSHEDHSPYQDEDEGIKTALPRNAELDANPTLGMTLDQLDEKIAHRESREGRPALQSLRGFLEGSHRRLEYPTRNCR